MTVFPIKAYLARLRIPVLRKVFCEEMLRDFAVQIVLDELLHVGFTEAVFVVFPLESKSVR